MKPQPKKMSAFCLAAILSIAANNALANPQSEDDLLNTNTPPSSQPMGGGQYGGSDVAAINNQQQQQQQQQQQTPTGQEQAAPVRNVTYTPSNQLNGYDPRNTYNDNVSASNNGVGAGQQVNDVVVSQTTRREALSAEEFQRLQQDQQQRVNSNAQTNPAIQRFWEMSDDEIRAMKTQVESKQAAIHQDVSPTRCDNNREIVLSGAPNESPPLLTLDTNNRTVLMFIDKAGTPFPIEYVVWQRHDIKVQYNQEDIKASLLFINAMNDYSQGTFTVKLQENPVPFVFVYAANQRVTDCMTTVRIDKISAHTPIEHQAMTSNKTLNTSLNSTLYGVAPQGSRPLKTSDKDFTAWQLPNGKVVIRSQYTMLSPMPKERLKSPDGSIVFVMDKSPSYLYKDGYQIKTLYVTYY